MENSIKKITKYFNVNYFKQNIKKSKAIILLFLIGYPILNTLVNLSWIKSETNLSTDYISSITWLNGIGLFIVPFILSVALMGFVFSKKEVDLIASMPIDKKTIFITNTIAGILIILILQLLLSISTLITVLVNVGSVMFLGQVVLSVFIHLSLAYICIFTIFNLAIALTGKIQGQIVLVVIMTLIFPVAVRKMEINWNIDYIVGDASFSRVSTVDILPEPLCGIFRFFNYTYSFGKTIYTLIFIAAMIALGTYLFKKKKLENSEDSFKNIVLYEIIKGITVIIILGEVLYQFFNYKSDNFISFLIVMTLFIAYYIVYDLLMGKKVLPKITIIGLVLTIIFSGIFGLIINLDHDFEETVGYEDIKEVGIDIMNLGYITAYKTSRSSGLTHIDTSYSDISGFYFTKNRDLIDILYDRVTKKYTYNSYKIDDPKDRPNIDANIILKLNNGKMIKRSINISESDLEKFAVILEKTNFRKFLNSKFNPNKAVYTVVRTHKGSDLFYHYGGNSSTTTETSEKTANEIKYLFTSGSIRELLYAISCVNAKVKTKESSDSGRYVDMNLYQNGRISTYRLYLEY